MPSGMEICLRESHSPKTNSPICSSLLGSWTLFNKQLENAPLPITVTESGIVISSNLVVLRAPSRMVCTDSGIFSRWVCSRFKARTSSDLSVVYRMPSSIMKFGEEHRIDGMSQLTNSSPTNLKLRGILKALISVMQANDSRLMCSTLSGREISLSWQPKNAESPMAFSPSGNETLRKYSKQAKALLQIISVPGFMVYCFSFRASFVQCNSFLPSAL